MLKTPNEGDKARPFSLSGDDGPIALKDHKGTNVVLYFYPKDKGIVHRVWRNVKVAGHAVAVFEAVQAL